MSNDEVAQQLSVAWGLRHRKLSDDYLLDYCMVNAAGDVISWVILEQRESPTGEVQPVNLLKWIEGLTLSEHTTRPLVLVVSAPNGIYWRRCNEQSWSLGLHDNRSEMAALVQTTAMTRL